VLASEPLHLIGVDVAAPESKRRRRPAAARDGDGSAQQRRRLEDLFDSMVTSLSLAEWAYVRARPSEHAREGAFRRLWSLKEAYIKARGDGLAFSPLSRAEFEFDEDGVGTHDADDTGVVGAGATLRVDGCVQPEWSFELGRLDDHWVSIAKGPPTAVIDAWGEFSATLAHPQLGIAGTEEDRATPSWEQRHVAALVPAKHADGYARARARDRESGMARGVRALFAAAAPP
jgi:4'-phosphopantetheinyl transferase